MKHLVGCVAYLLPSCFQRVNNKVSNKDKPKLPTPSENEVERHTVKQTMDNKMIPVICLGLGYEVTLKNVVTEQMADHQKKDLFHHVSLALTSALTCSACV
jgi:hypothetical protein